MKSEIQADKLRPILIMGAGGQLGQELLALTRARETSIIGLTRSQCDIADESMVQRMLDQLNPAVVINAAAYTAVDRAESEEATAFRANAQGPDILARETARRDVPLIHISTDYVFDGEKAAPYIESDPVNPLGVYGRSKLAGEECVRSGNARHVILRTAWVYGAYGHNFLKTILRLAGERDVLNIVGDQIGSPTASLDLAEAVLTAATQAQSGAPVWGTYHFCGTGVTNWHEFAQEIVAMQAPLTHRSPDMHKITTADYPTPARRPMNSALSSEKFVQTFAYRAAHWRERTSQIVRALLTPAAMER